MFFLIRTSITFENSIFFLIFFCLYERARFEGHRHRGLPRSQKLTLDFLKIPEGPKIDRKSLNYFLGSWLSDSKFCCKTSFKWHKVFSVLTTIVFQVLQPTHFISKISFLSKIVRYDWCVFGGFIRKRCEPLLKSAESLKA